MYHKYGICKTVSFYWGDPYPLKTEITLPLGLQLYW